MNLDQWMGHVLKAYGLSGISFTDVEKRLLLCDAATIANNQKESNGSVASRALDVLMRYFFALASRGATFGPVDRIRNVFGRTLEENYGVTEGPFLNLARTYWTYRLEIDDLIDSAPETRNYVLTSILRQVETMVAGLFFPTPGHPFAMRTRIEGQRKVLREFLSEKEVNLFIAQNPMLKQKSGCQAVLLGLVVFASAIAALMSF